MDHDSRLSGQYAATNAIASVAVAAFVIFALYWARLILIPMALAILLTFVLTPLVLALQRRGFGRVPSVAIVVFVTMVLVIAVGIVVVQQVGDLTRTLPDHADRIKSKAASIKGWAAGNDRSRFATLVNDLVDMFDGTTAQPGSGGSDHPVVVSSESPWTSRIQTYLSPATGIVGQAAFTMILVVFMLLRREDLRNRAIRLLGQGSITTTTKAVDETSRRISKYLLAQFLFNAAFATVIVLGLLIMGVPYAPLWGFIAFLMRYVPYIGTWIGVLPPALFTFAVFDGWSMTIGVLVLFLGIEVVANNFIEPLLYGPRLGLSEVAQLVATAFWAFLWGPVGIVLAWPLTTCVLMLGKYVPQLQFLNVLLGDQPVLAPHVALFQRLAARDYDEAADIVEKSLTCRSPDQTLDELLIPTLSLARQNMANGLLSKEEFDFVAVSIEEIAQDVMEGNGGDLTVEPRVHALFVPGKDGVDRAAATLLARIVATSQWEIELAATGMLTSELLATIESSESAIVVIVSLAPGGVTHARFLCKRIRGQHADLKIAVARWGDTADENARTTATLRNAGADEVATTVAATRAFLDGWRTVFAAPIQESSVPAAAARKSGKMSAIGTGTA